MRFLESKKINDFLYNMNETSNAPDVTIVNYKDFDFDKLEFGVPTKSKSGSYVANGLSR